MADRLDERLTGELRQAGGPSTRTAELVAARTAVLGELRRRHARRRARVAAVLATAVVAGVGSWTVVRWWPSPPGAGRSTAATGRPAGARAAPPVAGCARVIGTTRCVGTVSTVRRPATELGLNGGVLPSGSAAAPGAGPGQTLHLRVGRTASLVLPSGAGASWGQPRSGAAAAPFGAGRTPSATAVVRVGRVSRSGSTRAQRITVVGIRPGTVQVVARTACGAGATRAGATRSGCAPRQWTVEVEVSP